MADEYLQERSRIVEDLITRAWSDETFKALLLSDPAKAVEQAFGLALPASLTIKVLEETETVRYVVIPYRPQPCADLTDADLAAIAGGASASDGTNPNNGSTRSLVLRGITVQNQLTTTNLEATNTTLQMTAMC
jgi:hypothetical protein